MAYTADEKKILTRYFTSAEADIFGLTDIPEAIKGTLFSRYSRTAKDLRRLFLDEFVTQKELAQFFKNDSKKSNTSLDIARAEDFYERILVGYGDDSVAELGGAHVALENISMLATKSVEEHRLGLSPLEKSTRYVYFDKKVNGEYLYYRDPKIMKSKHKNAYIKACDDLFDAYTDIVRNIQPVLKKVYPGDENDTAYKFSIRAKACDIARGLLPLSALTNMGVYGNGRAFEYLLTTLLADPLSEVRDMAEVLNDSLRQVIPAFVKRATNERGVKYRAYLEKTEKDVSSLVGALHAMPVRTETSSVKLVEYDKDATEKIIAGLIYNHTNISYFEAYKQAKALSVTKKEKYLKAMRAHRENRHHKYPRPVEEAVVAFDIVADWGVYKDLMRHRILTRHRQLFTNDLGYLLPREIEMTGFTKTYCDAMDEAAEVYAKIKQTMPYEAQYIVTHGSYNRFYLKMNVREVGHLTELRSTPQGHPTYRKVAQDMANELGKKLPLIQKYLMPFVDYNDYELERLSAFKKVAAKAEKMGIKAFEE